MSKKAAPKPKVRVTFKHEGSEHGMAIGPVTVIDVSKYEADPHYASGFFPYFKEGTDERYVPQGVEDRGWQTYRWAERLAKSLGVELTEF